MTILNHVFFSSPLVKNKEGCNKYNSRRRQKSCLSSCYFVVYCIVLQISALYCVECYMNLPASIEWFLSLPEVDVGSKSSLLITD